MARYKTVLLDADGTLLDFEATERQALRRSMETRGIPFDDGIMQAYLDINVPLWAAHYRGEISRETLMVKRFEDFGKAMGVTADPEDWNREYLRLLGDCGNVLPGAVELLAALKPQCTLVLATNGLADIQRRRLRDNPIAPYLDAIFISEEMGIGKPEKGYFEQVLAALGADPAQTVMLGDDLNSDIQGAVNAGLDSIWYSRAKERNPLPTYQIGRLEQAAEIILEER
ncbi:MAG: YjjG family noncanonical pyrimidine nucleotidase [Oscillospiraceae bacterium]|jgi:YjjG family noncanonical pyrimidine nucleotidase